MSARLHAKSQGVAHHLPHRTRLRLPRGHRSTAKMKQAADALAAMPGVTSVEINERTGSILVHHDERPGILEAVGKTLAQSSAELLEALVEGGSPEVVGLAMVGRFISNLVTKTDDKVSGATGNMVDLASVAPLAMLAAGIWRWRRGRGEDVLMTISPLVLFWYAFDLYWRLNIARPAPQPGMTEAAVESPARKQSAPA